MVPKEVSWARARWRASRDSRPVSSSLIWFCTVSRLPTEPAWRSRLRSWLMAASAEVTRLDTSATVCVTSWACWDMASLVPSWVDRAPSVAW